MHLVHIPVMHEHLGVESAELARLVIRGARLADGSPADVAMDPTEGRIVGVGVVDVLAGDLVIDGRGSTILTTAVDPHAHLDKALSSRDVAAMPTTLNEAVTTWMDMWPSRSHADFRARAIESVAEMVRRGTTVIRTHVDVGVGVGLRAVEAMVELRDELRSSGTAELQIVGLGAPPFGGSDGAAHRKLLVEAIAAGIDVVGASPDIDPDPVGATQAAVDIAAESGLPLDVHTDQSVDPAAFWLPDLIRFVRSRGIDRVVASHCVSLASQPLDVQRRTASEMAELGIAVTTMPLTSLFYFGWDRPVAPPRGLTAVQVLRDAGVVVAAGADNVQDVFFPLGGFDAIEVATALAMAIHIDPADAWSMCTDAARTALGLSPTSVAVGEPADLLLLRGNGLADAIATASEHRVVIRHGRVIASTTVRSSVLDTDSLTLQHVGSS